MTELLPNVRSASVGTVARRHRHPPGRHRVAERMMLLAVFATAAIVGLAAGVDPLIAVASLAGLMLAVVTFTNLTAGLCVFVVAVFLEALPHVGGLTSVTKTMGVLLIVGWLAGAAAHHMGERRSRDLLARHPFLVWSLVLFGTWAVFSSIWAEDPVAARTYAVRFLLLFALFPIVYAAIGKSGHVQALFTIFILGALLSAAVGFMTGAATQDDGRLTGAGLNANQLGGLLMLAIVFAATLASNREWPFLARAGIIVAALLCGVALVGTASRGSMLGLTISMCVAPLLIGRGRRLRALLLVASVGFVAVVWLSVLAPDSLAVQRLTQASHSGSGRVDIWTVGLRMVDANPVMGVGAGNFKATSIHYLLEPGVIVRDEFIVDEPKVPHNVYLNVLVELGAVGLALFGAIVGYCLLTLWRAARTAERRGNVTVELLSRGLLIALIGILAAFFFSSQLYSKPLWLLLALGPALLAIAERSPGPGRSDARS